MKPKFKIGCTVYFKPHMIVTYSVNHKNAPMTIIGKEFAKGYGKLLNVQWEENGQIRTGLVTKRDMED